MSIVQKDNSAHWGELLVQERMGVPEGHSLWLSSLPAQIPEQHASFFESLSYIALGCLHPVTNQLWSTLLSNVRISRVEGDTILVVAPLTKGDPFVESILLSSLEEDQSKRLFAGVGIDFTNRRRNKLAGRVVSANVRDNILSLQMQTNENMGNCPKYITIRQFEPTDTRVNPKVTLLGTTLTHEALEILNASSTAYIATLHLDPVNAAATDMGLNHRGGPKGFIRYFKNENGGHLVLPDYSGNRFYQSLGNVETDGKISLFIADFQTGDSLHITGTATNLYNEQAERIMPRVKLLTLVSITEAIVIKGSIHLRLISDEIPSPYNPPLFLLASESGEVIEDSPIVATLTGIQKKSKLVSTISWTLETPMKVKPGGYVIFDFSTILKKQYQHMNNQNPRLVNDDFLRTWTVSKQSSPSRLEVTIKKSGLISTFLNSLTEEDYGLQVKIKGNGGELFEHTPRKMLWIAAGVGITPFLSIYESIKIDIQNGLYDVILLYSARDDEIGLVKDFKDVSLIIFHTSALSSNDDSAKVIGRRLQEEDLRGVDYEDRECFLCGPEPFMKSVTQWLVPHTSKIHTENFF